MVLYVARIWLNFLWVLCIHPKILNPKIFYFDSATFFANISTKEQDIIEWKSALKTADTVLGGDVILSINKEVIDRCMDPPYINY